MPFQLIWCMQHGRTTFSRTTQLLGRLPRGRTRTRTLDPLIKSQLLYQLSYAPARALCRGFFGLCQGGCRVMVAIGPPAAGTYNISRKRLVIG